VQARCSQLGLPAYLERSRSGQGWHLWVFFDPGVPARKARQLGFALLPPDALLTDGTFADPSQARGMEVLPKSDGLAGGRALGAQVWLPWYWNAKHGGNVFYRREAQGLVPYIPDTFEAVDEDTLDAALARLGVNQQAGPSTPAGNGKARCGGWDEWRREALSRLRLEDVYGDILTGRTQGSGWLEARDPASPSEDRTPSAAVADGTGEAERGAFKSFRDGRYSSVFDYLIERGRAADLREAQQQVADLTGLPLPERPAGEQAPPVGSGEAAGAASNPSGTRRTPKWIGSAAFAQGDYRPNWLVQGVLAAGQPGFVGGPSKSLKTNATLDLVISLGTATPFLGTFKVPTRVRVGILSGESGQFALQETAKRICAKKGVDLATADVLWGFELPQLANPEEVGALSASIAEHQIEVLVYDPLYLGLLAGDHGRAIKAENLFDVGPLLLGVTRACLQSGATPVILHHTKKTLAQPYEPLELVDLAYSGVAEFARQWILVNRREPFTPGTGQHKLWLTVGGSTGQSGRWAVDINEGVLNEDFKGRKRDVTINDPSQAKAAAVDRRETDKEQKKLRQIKSDGAKVLQVLDRHDRDGDGMSKTTLRTKTRLNADRLALALDGLEEEGLIEFVTGTVPGGGGARVPAQLIRRRKAEGGG
jgi:replicative DNA helicase